jgi:hypothetical protein
MVLSFTAELFSPLFYEKESVSLPANFELFRPQFHGNTAGCSRQDSRSGSFSNGVLQKYLKKNNGPSGNRTRVLGFEAQEDVLYPMDPSHLLYIKSY